MRFTKLFAVVITFLVLLSACQQEPDPNPPSGPTTVAEDKTYLNNTITNTLNCIRTVRDGTAIQALFRFMALSNGTVGNETWIENMSDQLELKMGTLELQDPDKKFRFSDYWGTYTWDRATSTFTKTPATGIFINFPSDPTQLTNNTNFRFATYTDGLYQANAENIYLPTVVKMSMLKDNVEIANVDYTGNFSSGSFPSPISVILSFKISPQNYKITVTRLSNVMFNAKVELFGGDCGATLDSKVTFLNDDYNNLDWSEDLSKIEATYTKGDFLIKGNWDARAYYQLPDINNPTANELNAVFTFSLNRGTEKIADLRFKEVGGSMKMYVYYKDGTSEDSFVYSDRFTRDLKEILRPYFGNDVDTWF